MLAPQESLWAPLFSTGLLLSSDVWAPMILDILVLSLQGSLLEVEGDRCQSPAAGFLAVRGLRWDVQVQNS